VTVARVPGPRRRSDGEADIGNLLRCRSSRRDGAEQPDVEPGADDPEDAEAGDGADGLGGSEGDPRGVGTATA
jgi:hypothetical protein